MSNVASTSVLSVRVSAEERSLLQAASEEARTSVSEFVRRKALDAAEVEMLQRSVVRIPDQDWEAFEAWAHKPARTVPGLKKLAGRTPTWEP